MASELEKYDYEFPEELIAQRPAKPRDSAGLLVYKIGSPVKNITRDFFVNLNNYLPPRSVLVLNQTRVIPARLELKKETGGLVKVLYIGRNKGKIYFLANRKLKPGEFLRKHGYKFEVLEKKGKEYAIKLPAKIKNFPAFLIKHGLTPIPPYIKHSGLREPDLRREYQTVFAHKPGSVAAPTASLHFTRKLINELKRKGHKICYVTLHVNLGTFAPVTEENLKSGRLHSEEYFISKPAARDISSAKKEGRKILAVGTTVVRALESAACGEEVCPGGGQTDIFIRPGYKFKIADGLITNFHVPKSSLLMLVSAFLSRGKIMKIYDFAVSNKMRLFSFGDGMLIV